MHAQRARGSGQRTVLPLTSEVDGAVQGVDDTCVGLRETVVDAGVVLGTFLDDRLMDEARIPAVGRDF